MLVEDEKWMSGLKVGAEFEIDLEMEFGVYKM